MLERIVEAEERDVQPVGQGGRSAAVVGVVMGDDNRLRFGLEGLQSGDNAFPVSFVFGAGINNRQPPPADQVGIRPRPGHRRGVGGDEPPNTWKDLGQVMFYGHCLFKGSGLKQSSNFDMLL